MLVHPAFRLYLLHKTIFPGMAASPTVEEKGREKEVDFKELTCSVVGLASLKSSGKLEIRQPEFA